MEGDQPSTSGAPQAAQASAAHPVLPAAAPPLPRQEVITLPLCPSVRQQLLSAGLRTVADLQGLKPLDLAREANISPADAYEALRVAVDGRRLAGAGLQLTGARSAAEIYEIQSSAKKIVTFCPDLDAVLGGGVPTGSVTEFCGVPGVGKTQLGMQLAVDVQIPEAFGGVGGGAVYVDTEGSFMVERLVDIASAAVDHVQAIAQRAGTPEAATAAASFTLPSILSNILYFRVHDYVEQLALVATLEALLQVHPTVKLVVVDSITFHFRQDFRDMAQRSRLLTRMAQDVMALAERHALAAVFMNQVTTKVLDGGSTSKLVPALGESWGHAASTRVILYWQGPDRHAHVYKSQSQPPATARYVITADGVRAAAPPAAMAATAAATTSAAAAGPPAGAQQDNKRRAPPPAEDGRDYYHEQGAVAAAGWQQQLGPGGRAVDQSYVATAANKRPAR